MYSYSINGVKHFVKFNVTHYAADSSLYISYSKINDDGSYSEPVDLTFWAIHASILEPLELNHVLIDKESHSHLVTALEKSGAIYATGRKIIDRFDYSLTLYEYVFVGSFLTVQNSSGYMSYLRKYAQTQKVIQSLEGVK